MDKILDALSKWIKYHPEEIVNRVYVEYTSGLFEFGIVFRSGHYIDGLIDRKMVDDDIERIIINRFNEEYKLLKEVAKNLKKENNA